MIAQTNTYALNTCPITNHNVIIRLIDNAICYIRDDEANMLVELAENEEAFNTVCRTYTYLNPYMEKRM